MVGGFEASGSDLGHRQLLVIGFLGRDDGRVGGQREMDARIRHQVGLELVEVDVEGAVEAEGGRDGGDDLTNQPKNMNPLLVF